MLFQNATFALCRLFTPFNVNTFTHTLRQCFLLLELWYFKHLLRSIDSFFFTTPIFFYPPYFRLSVYRFPRFFCSTFISATSPLPLLHGSQPAHFWIHSTSLLLLSGLPLATSTPELAALYTAIAISLPVSLTDFLSGLAPNVTEHDMVCKRRTLFRRPHPCSVNLLHCDSLTVSWIFFSSSIFFLTP